MTTQVKQGSVKELQVSTSIFAPTLYLGEGAEAGLIATATDVSTYSIRRAKGRITGVGAYVSGAGAYALVEGTMRFSATSLDRSTTYQEMRKSYGFSAGVNGFWGWLGLGANASYHKQELTQVFKELSQQQKVEGSVHIKLEVTGMYPNVPVEAQAFLQVLQVTTNTGNTINIASGGDPTQNTGAQDQNGQNLPTKNNDSTITL